MNKRNLAIVASLAVLALLIAVGIFLFNSNRQEAESQGKLVFAKTFDLGEKVDRVVIATADDVIELQQKNSYWLIESKGKYYADFRLVHRFLSSINQSIFSVRLPFDEQVVRDNYLYNPLDQKEDSGMLIRTYIGDKMLDEVIVGLPDESGRYFFAKRSNENSIWLIDGQFDLPIAAKYWLLRPVLSIRPEAIESITIGKTYVQRENRGSDFRNEDELSVNTAPLLDVLAGINIVDAMNEQQFDAAGLLKPQPFKVIDVITFYGLEFICKLYEGADGQVWLNINLSTTPLPKSVVNDYIRDNSFLYDGWYFEVSPAQGHILRDFRLM